MLHTNQCCKLDYLKYILLSQRRLYIQLYYCVNTDFSDMEELYDYIHVHI